MRAIHDDLDLRTATDLERLSVAGETVWSRSGCLRYRGQGYEIRAEFPCASIDDDFASVVAESFHAAYARSYGYRDDAAAIEAVDWRPGGRARRYGLPRLDLGVHRPCSGVRTFGTDSRRGRERCPAASIACRRRGLGGNAIQRARAHRPISQSPRSRVRPRSVAAVASAWVLFREWRRLLRVRGSSMSLKQSRSVRLTHRPPITPIHANRAIA